MTRRHASAIAAAAIALALAPTAARAERPTTLAMGLSGTAEGGNAPWAYTLPASIEVATQVSGDVWWRATAGFGVGVRPDDGDGHVFAIRTGPQLQHCPSARWCVGASAEVGWGHARWDLTWREGPLTIDDLHVEARLRGAVALTQSDRVMIEASVGPRVRYNLRASDMFGPVGVESAPVRGLAAGVALVIRN